jgi:Holliday junction resolvase RusA-like endonuclease
VTDLPIAEFWVPGIPAPGGSKRAFVVAGKARITDDAKGNRDWKTKVAQVAHEAHEGPLLMGPLRVRFEFYVLRPKGHWGARGLRPSAPLHPTTKPDVLKLARSTEDALTGVLWGDDSQTVTLELEKRYSPSQGAAGCLVRVWDED